MGVPQSVLSRNNFPSTATSITMETTPSSQPSSSHQASFRTRKLNAAAEALPRTGDAIAGDASWQWQPQQPKQQRNTSHERKKEERGQVALLSQKNLTQLPESLFQTPNLTWLDISHNRLMELSDDIGRLTKLRRLALGNNSITVVSPQISRLQHLSWLDFTHNAIEHVPDSLGDLPSLTGLGLSDCRLREFPPCITRLTGLLKLGIFGNSISQIPRDISNLVNLTKLDMSNNRLVELPATLGHLYSLRWLNLSHNRLQQIPASLCQLSSLEELGLGDNQLCSLPNLGSLKNLKILPVNGNQLSSLGDWIGHLHELEKLDLSSNNLSSLPPCLFKMRSLVYLNFRKNQISQLPLPDYWNIQSYTAAAAASKESKCIIRTLNCSENQLEELPYGLCRLPLVDLQMRRNPFRPPPANDDAKLGCSPLPLAVQAANLVINSYDHSDMKKLIHLTGREMSRCNQLLFKKVRICHSCCRFYVHEPRNRICQVREPLALENIPLVQKVCSNKC